MKFAEDGAIEVKISRSNTPSTYRDIRARPFFPARISTIILHCPGFEHPHSRF
jgi:hypothetical protein